MGTSRGAGVRDGRRAGASKGGEERVHASAYRRKKCATWREGRRTPGKWSPKEMRECEDSEGER